MNLSTKNVYVATGIVIVIIALAGTLWLFQTPAHSPAMRESAWHACTEIIAQRLDIPADEAHAYRYTAVTSPSKNIYQANLYYISRPITYRCTVEQTPEGDWLLKDLHER